MSTTQLTQLLDLLDDAFAGPDWESLLGNLKSVTNEDWLWAPPGGRRCIRDVVQHVGGCKYMYHSQAFGSPRSLTWDHPLVVGEGQLGSLDDALGWLRAGHARLRSAIAGLADDAELDVLRGHHSRGQAPTRWIITTLMQHDLYHAGEINHLRALHQDDDE
jgi:hypothetical protein